MLFKNDSQDTFHNTYNITVKNLKDQSICSPSDIIIQGLCHIFIWVNKINSTGTTCKNSISLKMENIVSLKQ